MREGKLFSPFIREEKKGGGAIEVKLLFRTAAGQKERHEIMEYLKESVSSGFVAVVRRSVNQAHPSSPSGLFSFLSSLVQHICCQSTGTINFLCFPYLKKEMCLLF